MPDFFTFKCLGFASQGQLFFKVALVSLVL
jgi:hypothetical protein